MIDFSVRKTCIVLLVLVFYKACFSPFLDIGDTLAIFQSSDGWLWSVDAWKILMSAGVTAWAISFRNLVEISPGHGLVALFGFRFDRSVKTPFSGTLMSGANGMVLVPSLGC